MRQLNLNRELYHQHIKNTLSKLYEHTMDSKPGNLYVFKFFKTGEKPAQINIYENQDGTTTIFFAVGQNQVLSKSIAEELVKISTIKEFKSHSFYIKAIRNEDFDAFVEIVVEYGNTIESDKKENNRRVICFRGKQGDKIVVTKHVNRAFQVQGKPNLLFSEIIEILSKFLPFEQIIQQQLEFYETNLTTADIQGEFEAKLPNICNLLDDKLKVIITPSLALQKIEILLDDYSAFAFPILRGIEGVLKQIFLKLGREIDYKDGFGLYFIKEKVDYKLEEELSKDVNNPSIESKICKLYKYYNKHRHGLFHVDNDIVSTKIITLQEANNIINTSLTVLDECYICLN